MQDVNLLLANSLNPYLTAEQIQELRLDAARRVSPFLRAFFTEPGDETGERLRILWGMPDMFVPTKSRPGPFDVHWLKYYEQFSWRDGK